jgi:Xaa-Pro aminopeptidase
MSRLIAAFLLGFWLFGAWPLPQAAPLPKAVPMLAEQPLADFQARRARLRAQLKDGLVLVPGRVETSLGVSEKFFQDENFFYLTGVEASGAILLLTPVPYQGAQEILFLPRRDPQMERWTGPQPGPDQEAEQRFGVEKALPADTLPQVLRELGAALPDSGKIHPSPTRRRRRNGQRAHFWSCCGKPSRHSLSPTPVRPSVSCACARHRLRWPC